MKNKLFKTFTVVLLTLIFISHGCFHFEIPYPTEPEISVCKLGGEEDPLDDGDDKPRSP